MNIVPSLIVDPDYLPDLSRRYWVFIYDTLRPEGGLCDLDRTFNELKEVGSHLKDFPRQGQFHVFDSVEKVVVDEGYLTPHKVKEE